MLRDPLFFSTEFFSTGVWLAGLVVWLTGLVGGARTGCGRTKSLDSGGASGDVLIKIPSSGTSSSDWPPFLITGISSALGHVPNFSMIKQGFAASLKGYEPSLTVISLDTTIVLERISKITQPFCTRSIPNRTPLLALGS